MPSIDHLIVWIVVGVIDGALASRAITWSSEGFGRWRNIGLGLAGALIGGFLFRLFGWLPELDRIAVSLRDILAAVVGSLVLLVALWLWRMVASPK